MREEKKNNLTATNFIRKIKIGKNISDLNSIEIINNMHTVGNSRTVW